MSKAILISVGGSIGPIVYTLNQQKPEYIIFFASQQSQEQIFQILKQIEFTPKKFEQIVTLSAEDLNECYKTIKDNLLRILEQLQLKPEDIIVDYTGGTKTMSVATTLATIDFCNMYIYIGGGERDKGGVGVVIDGQEKMVYSANPWNELALQERKRVSVLFNSARYTSAIEILQNVYSRVSEDKKPFYGILTDIISGYENWDRFIHRTAKDNFYKGQRALKTYLCERKDNKLHQLLTQVESNIKFLSQITDYGNDRALICDLIANAKRRADLEHKYDDAVARLYRTAEMIAQERLKTRHDIKTNDVDENKIPESIRKKFKEKYTDPKDGKIKISLRADYQLLKELKDELAQKFWNNEDLQNLLSIRNNTILAHGNESVKQDNYNKLLKEIMQLGDIKQEELPVFPILDL